MDSLPSNFEVIRAASTTVRAKPADEGGMPLMEVRFSKFGEWYEIKSRIEGHFLERIMPGAFAKTIAEQGDRVKVLFNHGFDPQIGEKVLGSIESLTEEKDSPVALVRLFDTSYTRDLVPGLEAGVYGSSMRMRVADESWDDAPARSAHNPEGIRERTIHAVQLFEAGPVTWPANPGSTSGTRSTTDAYYEGLRSRDPMRVDELTRSLEHRRTPSESASEGAASNPPSGPAQDHPGGLSAGERRQRITHLSERK